jgi:hypothetical protein
MNKLSQFVDEEEDGFSISLKTDDSRLYNVID